MSAIKRLCEAVGWDQPIAGERVQAVCDGTVIAESDATVVVDGRHYFPPQSLLWQHLEPVDKETVCLWKGVARYYSIQIGDRRRESAAWTYPEPSRAAASICDHVAFKRCVKVRRARPAA